MKVKRIFDKKDLARYEAEREKAYQEERAKLAGTAGMDEVEIETLALQRAEKRTIAPPKLDYISLADTGTTPEQNFSDTLVLDGLRNNIIEIHDDELLLHVHPETLRYAINRSPGRYCLHCGERLEGDENGTMARLHVEMKHHGVASPDPTIPAGYVWLKEYQCVLNAEQHKKFCVTEPARAPHYPLKEEV